MHDTEQTIRLDDLHYGKWYRVTLPIDCVLEVEFGGLEDRFTMLREEGSTRWEPWPTSMIARSHIEPMPAPFEIVEPLFAARERLDAADNQQVPPWPRRDLRILLCLAAASLAGWIALFLYCFPIRR